ncbi:hypothetical protein Lal_00024808 [Lupinus albus]|nr:hypothetical protein Lal_00024808 [Lupinus albus]
MDCRRDNVKPYFIFVLTIPDLRLAIARRPNYGSCPSLTEPPPFSASPNFGPPSSLARCLRGEIISSPSGIL